MCTRGHCNTKYVFGSRYASGYAWLVTRDDIAALEGDIAAVPASLPSRWIGVKAPWCAQSMPCTAAPCGLSEIARKRKLGCDGAGF